MVATKYRLGMGMAGNLLVLAMLVGASGYMIAAANGAELGPLALGGRTFGGPGLARAGAYGAALLFGGGALYLLILMVRNRGVEKFVTLDANQIVVSGLSVDGRVRTVSYAEVVAVADHAFRGLPAVEIRLRDGDKIELGAVQFASREQYQAFRNQLELLLPASVKR